MTDGEKRTIDTASTQVGRMARAMWLLHERLDTTDGGASETLALLSDYARGVVELLDELADMPPG